MVDRPGPGETGSGREEADERDQVDDQRDRVAGQRDQAGDERDRVAGQRVRAGDERDHLAEQRDISAEQSEARDRAGTASDIDALSRSAQARREAFADRRAAADDRRDGTSERANAEEDRDTASADRTASASERAQAEGDRGSARHAREASAQERQQASRDGLTGVLLRDAGFAELERDIARTRRTGQPLVLAFIDVDHLKAVNDSLGHAAGDRMLVEVVSAIRAKVRPYDLIVRYGGDEFLCAVVGLTLTGARARFALVNAALQASEHTSITAGLAQLQQGESAVDLIARADAALYQQRP